VALALAGAVLPGGMKIKRSKIRGVESNGMMCSEVELGMADTSDGIMILPKDTPVGLNAIEALGLADHMLDVGITPNRADLLSIRGLAREIGAVTEASFKEKAFGLAETGPPVEDGIKVKVEPDSGCSRYSARIIRGVKVGPSPERIKARLLKHGIRPINNVVDVTNYVLLELGSPMHAFDLSKISGAEITVRKAARGESIETIDNKVRELEEGMCVIADSAGAVAVAGVMGGAGTEVSDATVDVLLECACFDPIGVRRTARRLNLSTDSSYRFERGVDMEGIPGALDTAAALIVEAAGGVVARGVIDVYEQKFTPPTIDFRTRRVKEILGIEIGGDELTEIFKTLGMEVAGEETMQVSPPSYRGDILTETDLLEEAARMHGYAGIPTTLPHASILPGAGVSTAPISALKRRIVEILTNAGLFEVQNYSFVSKASNAMITETPGVEIINPLSEEQVVMRASLLPSLLENLRSNLAKKNGFVRIFEIAPVFAPSEGEGELPTERWKVAGLMYGPRRSASWNNPADELDFYDLTGLIERLFAGVRAPLTIALMEDKAGELLHPGKAARIDTGNLRAGLLGEAHPEVLARFGLKRPAFLFEFDIEAVAGACGKRRRYKPLARFPESARDIAFIVDESVEYREINKAIKKINTKLIEKVELFDVYYAGNIPKGKRSLALRVIYRSVDGTLTQPEVEEIHSKVTKELVEGFGVEIRG
jgi:phenylalanyl-tRNA synthetase beta chain